LEKRHRNEYPAIAGIF